MMSVLKTTLNLTKKHISFNIWSRNISQNAREVKIPMPWGHIAGKWYGPTNQRPILTLHGWKDNLGSMTRILDSVALKDISFLCIDYPGHGKSSKYPSGMFYDYKEYTFVIHYIKKHFGLEKMSLFGHSIGAAAAYAYGMLFFDEIDFLICLENGKPPIRDENDVAMKDIMDKFIKYDSLERNDLEPRAYTYDELVAKYEKVGVDPKYAKHILERNIKESAKNPGKFYIVNDPRINTHGFWNFPQNEALEYSKNMEFPIFMGKTRSGGYWEKKENFYEVLEVNKKYSKGFEYHFVEGTHFSHLNEPDVFGKPLREFILKHTASSERKIVDVSDKMELL